jgi:hypothetical protein
MRCDFGLDVRDMRQGPVPPGLEFARHQPVDRIGSVILPERALGGIARRFEVAIESFSHLIAPLACLGLGDRSGRDGARADNAQ